MTTPPDVQFASGPTQEVEFVNLYGEIFNLTGASRGSFYLGNFFQTGTDYLSDPKILYDNESDRWFASILHINSAQTAVFNVLAVSSSSDASGTWTVYSLPDVPGDLGDQPILGLSSSLIGLAVNLFSGSSLLGVQFWIVNKSSAVAGGVLAYQAYGPSGVDYSLHPVEGVSPNGTLRMVQVDPFASNQIDLVSVTGVPPATPVFSNMSFTVSSISGAPGAPMPSSTNLLDPGDPRIQSAVYGHGSIWLVFSDQCVPSGDVTNRGCVRFVQINTSTPAIVKDFDYGVAKAYLLYPAVAVGPDGTVLMVYGESSSTVYPSIYATGRGPSDPSGSFAPPTLLRAGTSAMTGGLCSNGACRYGDYFGAAWTPNDTHAWLAGEFVGATGATWGTAFAEATYSTAAARQEVHLSAAPTVLDAGQSTTVTFRFLNSTCVSSAGNSCRVHIPLVGSNLDVTCTSPFTAANATVTFSAAGNFTIGAGGYLDVFNSSSCSGSPALNLSATPVIVTVHPAPSLTYTASPAFPVDVGVPVTLKAVIAGGSGGASFLWSSLPPGCSPTPSTTLSCTPTAAGVGRLTVSATDSVGVQTQLSAGFVIEPDPSVSVNASTSTIEVGQSVEFTATAAGGVGTPAYSWNGLPTGCAGRNTADLLCTPGGAGSFNTTATVSDSFSFRGTSRTVEVVVVAGPKLSIVAAPPSVVVGEVLNLSALVVDGSGPFTFTWSGLPTGCPIQLDPSWACRPIASGQFKVVATVTDSLGGVATADLTVSVSPAPSGSSPSPWALFGSQGMVVLLLIVVLIVGIGVFLAVRARGRK
ncbi:MAG: hypothetical protein L3J95_00120 [Thermoplasmata archaeon]|nr:hypothetical protein [Thermoplasmata archaeon]MCI4358826.1 hypothetical protein [Thermoplasmata archaeon]